MNSTFQLRPYLLYTLTGLLLALRGWAGPYILYMLTLTVYRLAGGGLSYGTVRNGLTYPYSPKLAGICRLLNVLPNTLSPGNELYFSAL